MSEQEEAMERRRLRAQWLEAKVNDMLFRLLMVHFRLTYNEFKQEVDKRNKKLKKKQVAASDRDDDLEALLEKEVRELIEKNSKHIVNFLREQFVKE